MSFKSGFVNVIGKPNVGKSTLINQLVKDRISIINKKPQTTRKRTFGILSSESYQVVFSDTPGYINNPKYRMQEKMNKYVLTAFEDADVLILVIDKFDKPDMSSKLLQVVQRASVPKFLVLNKCDELGDLLIKEIKDQWLPFSFDQFFSISALTGDGIEELHDAIIDALPEGPQYFPPDQLSDRSERFFVAEMVRETILEQYHEEIPYSCEVQVTAFKRDENILRIAATIFVNRKTQKAIVIGKNGSAIKALGIASRKKLEAFFETKIFLELHVKVRENWRNNEQWLRKFGYNY